MLYYTPIATILRWPSRCGRSAAFFPHAKLSGFSRARTITLLLLLVVYYYHNHSVQGPCIPIAYKHCSQRLLSRRSGSLFPSTAAVAAASTEIACTRFVAFISEVNGFTITTAHTTAVTCLGGSGGGFFCRNHVRSRSLIRLYHHLATFAPNRENRKCWLNILMLRLYYIADDFIFLPRTIYSRVTYILVG